MWVCAPSSSGPTWLSFGWQSRNRPRPRGTFVASTFVASVASTFVASTFVASTFVASTFVASDAKPFRSAPRFNGR